MDNGYVGLDLSWEVKTGDRILSIFYTVMIIEGMGKEGKEQEFRVCLEKEIPMEIEQEIRKPWNNPRNHRKKFQGKYIVGRCYIEVDFKFKQDL